MQQDGQAETGWPRAIDPHAQASPAYAAKQIPLWDAAKQIPLWDAAKQIPLRDEFDQRIAW